MYQIIKMEAEVCHGNICNYSKRTLYFILLFRTVSYFVFRAVSVKERPHFFLLTSSVDNFLNKEIF